MQCTSTFSCRVVQKTREQTSAPSNLEWNKTLWRPQNLFQRTHGRANWKKKLQEIWKLLPPNTKFSIALIFWMLFCLWFSRIFEHLKIHLEKIVYSVILSSRKAFLLISKLRGHLFDQKFESKYLNWHIYNEMRYAMCTNVDFYSNCSQAKMKH